MIRMFVLLQCRMPARDGSRLKCSMTVAWAVWVEGAEAARATLLFGRWGYLLLRLTSEEAVGHDPTIRQAAAAPRRALASRVHSPVRRIPDKVVYRRPDSDMCRIATLGPYLPVHDQARPLLPSLEEGTDAQEKVTPAGNCDIQPPSATRPGRPDASFPFE